MTLPDPADPRARALAKAAEGRELSPVERLHVDMWQVDARQPFPAGKAAADDEYLARGRHERTASRDQRQSRS